ncbi:ATP-binding protein [Pseudochelatococcus contaminans]|uniref:histidine kinase n=1 Tax=Pseudochelatococcus contaminans TaxID=1538103 RepID=A0A7W5Z4M6_9HYPH|nr:ATP-binding protein [Pseudochelatococcus contaminans]MBB3809476.1 signal transduction histidine kinase [Pseudochelatococcus contaminans]
MSRGSDTAGQKLWNDPALAELVERETAAVLWSLDGSRVIGASVGTAGLAPALRAAGGENLRGRLRRVAAALSAGSGVRLERVTLPQGYGITRLLLECHRVATGDGEFLLTILRGPLPRLPRVVVEQEPISGDAAPVAAEAVAVRPHDDVPDAAAGRADQFGRLFAFAGSRPTVRFIWESDTDGCLTRVSTELAALVGHEAGAIGGRTWPSLVDAGIVVDPGDGVAAALARQATWSGKEVQWRVGDDADMPRLIVEMAGIPVHDGRRRFRGYRGFGIARVARLRDSMQDVDIQEALTASRRDEPRETPDTRPRDEGHRAGLSDNEKQAFRDIAKALGVLRSSAAAEAQEPARSEASAPAKADKPQKPTGRGAAGLRLVPDETEKAQPEVKLPPAPAAEAEQPVVAERDASMSAVSDSEVSHAKSNDAAPAPFGTLSDHMSHRKRLLLRPVDDFDETETETAAPPEEEMLPPLADTGSPDPLPEKPEPRPAIAGLEPVSAELDTEGPLAAMRPDPVDDEPEPVETPAVASIAVPPPDVVVLREVTAADTVVPDTVVPDVMPAVARLPVSALPPAAEAHEAASSDARVDVGLDVSDSVALIANRLPIGMIVSRDTETLFVNRALLDLLGYEDAAAFRSAGGLRSLFVSTPGGGDAPLALRTAYGAPVSVDARMTTIPWADQDRPATLISFRRAIEPRTEAHLRALERELRHQEARVRALDTILDTATDGVVTLDGLGRLLSMNRSAEALFGCEETDVVGGTFWHLLSPESRSVATAYFEGLRAGGLASVLNDGLAVRARAPAAAGPGADEIPLTMIMGRLAPDPGDGAPGTGRGHAGRSQRFFAILRDVSGSAPAAGHIAAPARLESGDQAQFLARVSHEIRTPLNAIIGFAEVMLEERFGPIGTERYREYLRDIHSSGGQVISLVNDLLDLARIEAGRLELAPADVLLNHVVSACVGLMMPQAERQQVVLRTSLPQGLPSVNIDERALQQIVLNLLSNAVKFTDAGGQVIVSTARTDDGGAALRIRDTGIGMTRSQVTAALTPFAQLNTTHLGRADGAGLGLPLTRALVEASGGRFSITSTPTEGTLVEIVFPRTAAAQGKTPSAGVQERANPSSQ